jgi:hypothetical protein
MTFDAGSQKEAEDKSLLIWNHLRLLEKTGDIGDSEPIEAPEETGSEFEEEEEEEEEADDPDASS